MEAGQISDEDEFRKVVTQGLTFVDEDKIMSIAERRRQEGLKQGIEQGIQQGMEKGIEKRIEQGIMLIAKNMLAENIPLDLIKKFTGIPTEQLKHFN